MLLLLLLFRHFMSFRHRGQNYLFSFHAFLLIICVYVRKWPGIGVMFCTNTIPVVQDIICALVAPILRTQPLSSLGGALATFLSRIFLLILVFCSSSPHPGCNTHNRMLLTFPYSVACLKWTSPAAVHQKLEVLRMSPKPGFHLQTRRTYSPNAYTRW